MLIEFNSNEETTKLIGRVCFLHACVMSYFVLTICCIPRDAVFIYVSAVEFVGGAGLTKILSHDAASAARRFELNK